MTARRSSYFCRQLNSVLETTRSSSGSSTKISDEEQLILNHVDELERVISDWRNEYWRTKSEYKQLEKYKDNVNVIEYNQCKDILLPEDVEFLNNRLDYSTLNRKLETLVAKVEIAKVLMCKANARLNGQVDALPDAIVKLKRQLCQVLLEWDEGADLFV